MAITARQYMDKTAAEYHYYSKRVKVINMGETWYGQVIRHLQTTEDYVVEVRPDNAHAPCAFRISPDNVFLE